MKPFYEKRSNDLTIDYFDSPKGCLQCLPHLHYHIELVLMLEGRTGALADAERCLIESGDAYIAFPNQVHCFESTGAERYYILIVNPDTMPELASLFSETRPVSPLLRGVAKNAQAVELAKWLYEQRRESGRMAEIRRRGYLLSLFSILLEGVELKKSLPEEAHALKAIVNYCTKHYQKELSLSLLQEELHISKYYISHLFSDRLGIGFNEYVNSLRISFACRRLQERDVSITEVSSLSGFGTLRTFNRAFQKRMGCAPSEYRAATQAKSEKKNQGET